MRRFPILYPNRASDPSASLRNAWSYVWKLGGFDRGGRKNGVAHYNGGRPAHVPHLRKESRWEYALVIPGCRTSGKSERGGGLHGPAYASGSSWEIPRDALHRAETDWAEWEEE